MVENLPNFGKGNQRRASKTFFGPRCLCQIFVTVGVALVVLVLVEEKSKARQQNVFRFFSPRCLCQNFALLCAVTSVPGAFVKFLFLCA